MIRTNYPKPSNLLLLLKLTGKSYWDMIGYSLPEVTVTANYPHELRVWNTVNLARYGFNEPEFLRRLDYNDRRYIKTPYGGELTHLMANDGNYAYPMILDINGTLHNYDEKYGDYWNRDPKENGDYIKFLTPGDARYFAEHYKKNWPIFFQGAFKNGKDTLELPGFEFGTDGDEPGFFSQLGNSLKRYAQTLIEVPKAIGNIIIHGNANGTKHGSFGGGSFNGNGVGGSWNPILRGDTTFNDAYDNAVKRGVPYFWFGGKKYNTKKENNPIREYNNRWVGNNRMSSNIRKRKGYGKDYGPIPGAMNMFPMTADTYNKRLFNRPKGSRFRKTK